MINFKNIIMVIENEYEYGGKLNGIFKNLACFIVFLEILLSLRFIFLRPYIFSFNKFFDLDICLYITLMVSLFGIGFSNVFSTNNLLETHPRTIKLVMKTKTLQKSIDLRRVFYLRDSPEYLKLN